MRQATSQKMADKVKETSSDLGAKTTAALHTAQETASEWTQKAQKSLGAVTDATAEYTQQGREKMQAAGRALGDQVQERPVSALLLAVGLGFLLGVLLVRR